MGKIVTIHGVWVCDDCNAEWATFGYDIEPAYCPYCGGENVSPE